MCRAGLMVVGIRAMKNKEPTGRMAPKYMVTKQMESHSDAAEDEKQRADVLTKGLTGYKFKLGVNLTRGTKHRCRMGEIVALAHGNM